MGTAVNVLQQQADGSYSDILVLSTRIKTAEQKDLVISFTAEASLVTDTKIVGKGSTEVSDMDRASIFIWATVDGVKAFPDEVTLAERVQILKGRLSEWTIGTDPATGAPVLEQVPEYVELILDTTEANGLNFLALNVGSGEHVIQVWARIELVNEGGTQSPQIAGVIGDRTLVVHEIRLIQGDTLGP